MRGGVHQFRRRVFHGAHCCPHTSAAFPPALAELVYIHAFLFCYNSSGAILWKYARSSVSKTRKCGLDFVVVNAAFMIDSGCTLPELIVEVVIRKERP